MMPKKLGPYEIHEEIGRGGTAFVYRAVDLRNGRTVALKVMPPEFAMQEAFLQRFLREGKNVARLRHPNIVQVYEVGKEESYHYIAMEYVAGGTLSDYVRKRNTLLPLRESLDVLAQVGDALDYAHAQGFVHRDVKMSNILMGENGRVLLADFGVAKNLVGEQSVVTATGYRVGTPSYMSPEQITGKQSLDQRSDVYSFGVMAYSLFTGRSPFSADNQAELMYKVVHQTAPSPDTLNPELPPHIVQALNRVLAKEPKLRFSSAFEFVTALVKPPTVLAFGSSTEFDEPTTNKLHHKRFRRVLRNGLVMATVVLGLFLLWPYRGYMQTQAFHTYQSAVEPRIEQASGLVADYTDPKTNPEFWEVEPIDWYGWQESVRYYGKQTLAKPKILWQALKEFRPTRAWVNHTWQSLQAEDTQASQQ